MAPSVGGPLVLSAVAVGSFSVHVAVLSNTSWVSDFLSGVPLGTGDEQASAETLLNADPEAARASFTIPNEDGTQQVLVVMPDGRTATAVLQMTDALTPASAPILQLPSH